MRRVPIPHLIIFLAPRIKCCVVYGVKCWQLPEVANSATRVLAKQHPGPLVDASSPGDGGSCLMDTLLATVFVKQTLAGWLLASGSQAERVIEVKSSQVKSSLHAISNPLGARK